MKPSSIHLYTKQTGEKNELLHAIFSGPHTPGHRPVCTVRTIDIFVPSSSISQVPLPFLYRTDLAFGNLFVRCSCRFSLGSFIVLAIAVLLLSICLEWTGMSQKTRNILWDSCEISRRSSFSHQIKLLRISTMKYLPHSFCIALNWIVKMDCSVSKAVNMFWTLETESTWINHTVKNPTWSLNDWFCCVGSAKRPWKSQHNYVSFM